MEPGIKTVYDASLHAHVATIDPPLAPVQVFVHIDKYEHVPELDELFLYNFDRDSNCIEFAFGERMEDVEEKKYISYTTDPRIHKPPFRIQITHQLDTVDLKKYEFTVSYALAV